MPAQAFQGEVSARWVTGDSVYGDDRRLRMWLEEHAQAYVLAVSGKEYIWLGWRGNGRSKRSSPRCPWMAGRGAVLTRVRKARGGMTDAGGPWLLPYIPRGAAGCWSGEVYISQLS